MPNSQCQIESVIPLHLIAFINLNKFVSSPLKTARIIRNPTFVIRN